MCWQLTKSLIAQLIDECKKNANQHGWNILWRKSISDLTVGEALALMHSEISEALEKYRNDDFEGFSKEIAGLLIRVFHLCGDLGIDVEKHIMVEMKRNKERPFKHGRANY